MADEIVEYLVANLSAQEIATARDAVFTAHLSGLQETVIITSSSFEGGSATGQLSVAPSMREQFLRQCRMALARLNGTSATMSAGLQVRFDQRATST